MKIFLFLLLTINTEVKEETNIIEKSDIEKIQKEKEELLRIMEVNKEKNKENDLKRMDTSYYDIEFLSE